MAIEEEDPVLQASISGLDIGAIGGPSIGFQENKNGDRSQQVQEFTSPSVRARDITSEFTKAAAALDTGELVKDEAFSLFDAVGALEIMDPKMDSGYLNSGDDLEEHYDVSQALHPGQVLGVMDDLLSAEVAWHMGHPLSQTLFTSVYIDYLLWPEPTKLEEASFFRTISPLSGNPLIHVVLRSYCLALIKACDSVHRLICSETFYEEEDFVSNLFNRSLLASFPVDDICVLVEHAITTLDTIEEIDDQLQEGILTRLKYRIAFLRAVSGGPGLATSSRNEYWKACLECISIIESSHANATLVDDSFSIKIQKKLASTVPPRPIIKLDFALCSVFLRQMFTNALESEAIFDCPRASCIINFLEVFFSQKPQPAIYIRCLLQSFIFQSLRGPRIDQRREFFFQELEELVLPVNILTDRSNAQVELPQDNRFKIWEKMTRLIEQVSEPFFDILRALCMNRSRARRMLCNLLNEWDGLQLDLEDLDNELRALTSEIRVFDDMWELPLSSWGYFYKLRKMQWIIQLGFELEMYHSDEWAGMYRYLLDVADHRHKHIERIYSFLQQRAQNTRGLTANQKASLQHSEAFLVVAAGEASGTVAMAESFACLYQALSVLDLLPKPPPRPYGTEKLRQALRMRPFLPLCLPILQSSSEPFDAINGLAITVPVTAANKALPRTHRRALALLDAADAARVRARRAWDSVSKASAASAGCVGSEKGWREGIKQIIRSAVMAGVAGAQVRRWVMAGAVSGELDIKINDGTRDEDMPGGLAASWMVPQVSTT